MEEFFAAMFDRFSVVFSIAFGVLVLIVVVRVIIKAVKGERIHITPVGAMRDLPESVTGIHDDFDKETVEEDGGEPGDPADTNAAEEAAEDKVEEADEASEEKDGEQ